MFRFSKTMDSKFQKRGRMVRRETKDESSGKKKMGPKKSISHHDDDDDSVDSYGNIRGLIDYENDSDESSSSEEIKKRKPRKAAIKAREKIKKHINKKRLESESEESEPSSYMIFIVVVVRVVVKLSGILIFLNPTVFARLISLVVNSDTVPSSFCFP